MIAWRCLAAWAALLGAAMPVAAAAELSQPASLGSPSRRAAAKPAEAVRLVTHQEPAGFLEADDEQSTPEGPGSENVPRPLPQADGQPNAFDAPDDARLGDGANDGGVPGDGGLGDTAFVDQSDWGGPSYPMIVDPRPNGRLWVRPEWIMWWSDSYPLPSLVTTSPDGTPRPDAGVLGLPGTQTLFGARLADGDARNGARLTAGLWFNDEHGWFMQWFSMGDGEDDDLYWRTSNGYPILARPFYDTTTDQEASQLIAFPGVVDGSVNIALGSEIHAAGTWLRCLMLGRGMNRLDFVAGYRFFGMREYLSISEDLVSTDQGGLIPLGTTFDVDEHFVTRNQFHGGDLGLLTTLTRGVLSLETQAKLALGTIHQELEIRGRTVTTVPGLDPSTTQGGLLAQPSNIGSFQRNRFGMLPEFNINLRVLVTQNVEMTLGHTLILVDEVLRLGNQLDTNVNTTQFQGGTLVGAPAPVPPFIDNCLWINGFNLGMHVRF